LYKEHPNFWIEPPDPVLSRKLTHWKYFVCPRVFVWMPEEIDLVSDIKCPKCTSKTKLKGWPDKPVARRVVGLHDCYWILYRRHTCTNPECHKNFSSLHPKVLQQLPIAVRNRFPAFLTAKSGLDMEVVHMLRASVAESCGMNPFRKLLAANHARKYASLKLDYNSVNNAFAVPSFPDFDDREGYGGFVPSSKYLGTVYVSFILMHEQELAAQMVKASADIISVDHSFKVCLNSLDSFD
jgi:hypothetical protein